MPQTTLNINAKDNASSSLKSVTSGMADVKAAVDLAMQAFDALKDIVVDVVTEFTAAETASAKLDAVLEATSYAANLSRTELDDLTDSLADMTGFAKTAINEGESMLLTFRNIGEDVFPRALESTADLAAFFGTDMSSAAMQLGKALNEPAEGLTKLSRQGITFSDEQEAMVQAMVDAGDTAGAQAVILAELENQVGGVAAAMRDTYAGALENFTSRSGEAKEVVGEMFATMSEGLLNAGADLMAWLTENPALLQGLTTALVAAGAAFAAIAVSAGLAEGGFIAEGIAAAAAWAATLGPITLIVAGVAAVSAAVLVFVKNMKTAEDRATDLEDATFAYQEAAAAAANATDDLAQKQIEAAGAFQDAQDAAEKAIKAYEKLENQIDKLNAKDVKNDEKIAGLEEEKAAYLEILGVTDSLAAAQLDTNGLTQDQLDALDDLEKADRKLEKLYEKDEKIQSDIAEKEATQNELANQIADAVAIGAVNAEDLAEGLQDSLENSQGIVEAVEEIADAVIDVQAGITAWQSGMSDAAKDAQLMIDNLGGDAIADDFIGSLERLRTQIDSNSAAYADNIKLLFDTGKLSDSGAATVESYREMQQALADVLKKKAETVGLTNDEYNELLNLEMELNGSVDLTSELASTTKKADDAAEDLSLTWDSALGTISQVVSELSGVFSDFYNQQQERIDAELEAQLAAIDAETQARLEAAGLADKTEEERVQDQIARINRQIQSTQNMNDRALLEAEKAELQSQLRRAQIVQDGEDERAEIEAQAARDTYQAELKQFRVDKAMSIVEATISAALAAMKALELGPIAGPIAAAVMAGLGAAQIAIIARQEPPAAPAFAGGGVMPYTGNALVGERGAELVTLPAGAQISNANDTSAMLGGINIQAVYVYANDVREFERQMRALQRTQAAR